ncbi:MAG: hypothetical protein KAI71_05450 [Candidatus Pacebacteria bacterium]|nr:hypothetical protein [Candidatus Paceibacterota bacterium]
MKQMNIGSRIVIFAILIASAGIVSGETFDREVNMEEDDLWGKYNYSLVSQHFDYEKSSSFVVNKIVLITEQDNFTVSVEDVSKKERTVLFNVSNGTKVALALVTLDGRQVETVTVNGTKIRIGLIELFRGQNRGFLETEIMIVKPRVEKE